MKPTRDGMILWAEQEAEKYHTVKGETLVDRMIPTPDELERRKRAVGSIVDDGWKGPEERPEDGAEVVVWLGKQTPLEWRGYFRHNIQSLCDWSEVICWHPIDFGPMPERFKVKEGKE